MTDQITLKDEIHRIRQWIEMQRQRIELNPELRRELAPLISDALNVISWNSFNLEPMNR